MITQQDNFQTNTYQARRKTHWLFVFIVLAQPFKVFSQSMIDAKQEYRFAHLNLEQALVEVAKLNNTQLIMQAKSLTEQKRTISCFCSISEILDLLLKNTHYRYRVSKSGSILIDLKPKVVNKTVAIDSTENYERILITGSAHDAKSILRSTSAVTVYNKSTFISQGLPNSADMLKHVPGFWVEDSGGEANNNVAPRGLRGGEGFRFISVMEDGLPISYDGIWVDFFQRQDIMTSAVETIRGGNSGIVSLNGPAAVVNFISDDSSNAQKNEFVIKQGVGHKSTRFDLKTVEKVNNNWHLAYGGFYRKSDGIREPGFTADKGGQFKVVSNYKNKYHSINVVGKILDDKTTFYSPIVFTGKESPQAVKQLSSTHGTLLSKAFTSLPFTYPLHESNVTKAYNIQDGQQTNMQSLGIFGHHEVNAHWRLSYKFRYSDMKNEMLTMLNLDNNTISTAKEYLSSEQINDFINKNKFMGAVQPVLKSTADNTIIDNKSDKLFSLAHPLYSKYEQYQWLSNANISFDYDMFSGTFGHYFARSQYTSLPLDKWLGQYLIDVKHQPQRFDVIALNNAGDEVAKMTREGQLSLTGPAYIDGTGLVRSHSLYGQLTIDALEELSFDLGLRTENLHLTSTAQTDKQYFIDQQYPVRYSSGNYFTREKKFKEFAWNIGINFTPYSNVALFANIADAFEMPRVTSFGNAIGWSNSVESVPDNLTFEQPVRLTFGELGVRYDDGDSSITAIVFQTKFEPLLVNVYRGKSVSDTIFMNTKTKGLEIEFSQQVNQIFSIKGTSVWQRARFNNIPLGYEESIYNGNQITRTPELQVRLEPMLTIDNFSLSIRYHYIGDRFSDIANKRKLPHFQYVDMNAKWQLTSQLAINLVGKNIFNSYGLTEGNPRTNDGLSSASHYYARPIFGRAFSLSIQYNF
ncbi:TonB-dependent receptor [Thalassotalea hakodatensis]|uniref:TonB-dependent receptor n=1 Tax=Thalassotalea hakodatensis TaxID=3030492 RepID=UPI0025739C86|nr:TonB-dependent receptor [Thalassotalea hakodatensis]